MKNLFLMLAFMWVGTFAFANNTEVKDDVQNSSIININGVTFSKTSSKGNVAAFTNGNKKSPLCRVSCSINVGGVEFTTEAGNFLSSCEGAARRCLAKLGRAVTQFLQEDSSGSSGGSGLA